MRAEIDCGEHTLDGDEGGIDLLGVMALTARSSPQVFAIRGFGDRNFSRFGQLDRHRPPVGGVFHWLDQTRFRGGRVHALHEVPGSSCSRAICGRSAESSGRPGRAIAQGNIDRTELLNGFGRGPSAVNAGNCLTKVHAVQSTKSQKNPLTVRRETTGRPATVRSAARRLAHSRHTEHRPPDLGAPRDRIAFVRDPTR
jgi:hypothetical protein